MSESILEIVKAAMSYQMLTTEVAAQRIALANVPVTDKDLAKLSKMENRSFAAMLNSSIKQEGLALNIQNQKLQTKEVYEPSNANTLCILYICIRNVHSS
jgi:flagellar basal body rod protein FlgC